VGDDQCKGDDVVGNGGQGMVDPLADLGEGITLQLQLHRLDAMAERPAGIVDFDGALLPFPLSLSDHSSLSWAAVATRVDAVLGRLPGLLVAATYRVSDQRIWASHFSDAIFLRAWLKHPDFHMVK